MQSGVGKKLHSGPVQLYLCNLTILQNLFEFGAISLEAASQLKRSCKIIIIMYKTIVAVLPYDQSGFFFWQNSQTEICHFINLKRFNLKQSIQFQVKNIKNKLLKRVARSISLGQSFSATLTYDTTTYSFSYLLFKIINSSSILVTNCCVLPYYFFYLLTYHIYKRRLIFSSGVFRIQKQNVC